MSKMRLRNIMNHDVWTPLFVKFFALSFSYLSAPSTTSPGRKKLSFGQRLLLQDTRMQPAVGGAQASFFGEYYTENRIWNSNAEANLEGVKAVIQIMGRAWPVKAATIEPNTVRGSQLPRGSA